MGFMNKLRSIEDDYVPLEHPADEETQGQVLIEVEKLVNYADSDRIQQKVRAGSVLLVKVKELRERDMTELKRAVERVKKTCLAIDGDIAGIGEDWLLVTGPRAKVLREAN